MTRRIASISILQFIITFGVTAVYHYMWQNIIPNYLSFPHINNFHFVITDILKICIINISLFLIYYGIPWLIYYSPLRITSTNITKLKFTPSFPSTQQQQREFKRSVISMLLGSCLEYVLRSSFHQNTFTMMSGSGSVIWYMAVGVIITIFWSDIHFYVVHRLLHISWLYKHIHSIHHESFNPEPFAGLSFHPLEAIIYYSSLLIFWGGWISLLSFNLPFSDNLMLNIYHFHLLKVILDLTPSFGHLGYGGAASGSHFHYLHHTKKHYNYGGTPLCDMIAGSYLAS